MLAPVVILALITTQSLAGQAPPVGEGTSVMSNHAARGLEEGVYLHVVATPLKARVKRAAPDEVLELVVVRLGPASGALEGAAAILVEVDGQSSTLPVRAPLERGRKAGDGLLASYPVRHRFPLSSPEANVVVTVVQGASGVGVQLRAAPAQPPGSPPLVPLGQTVEEGAADEEDGLPLAALPQDPPPEEPAPVAVETTPDASAPLDAASPTPSVTATPIRPALPMRLSAQVGVGGMLQVGGLTPALISGGVRVVTGAREGWLSRYAFGAGLDFEHQSARTGGSSPVFARWDATATRLRLEAQAGLLDLDLGFAPLDVTLLGGGGMILGSHAFQVSGQGEGALLLGPTFRVGAQAGLGLGPGAIVALVPVDLSVDVVGGRVQGFAPLATSLYVGYRLDL